MDSTRRDFIKVSAMGLAASSASGPSAFAARTFAAPISVWLPAATRDSPLQINLVDLGQSIGRSHRFAS